MCVHACVHACIHTCMYKADGNLDPILIISIIKS